MVYLKKTNSEMAVVLAKRVRQISESSDPYYTQDYNKIGAIVEGRKVNIEWKPDNFTINDLSGKGVFLISVDGASAGKLNVSLIPEPVLRDILDMWHTIKLDQTMAEDQKEQDNFIWFWSN